MEYICQITEDEYVRANKLFSKLSRKHWLFYASAITVFVVVAVLTKSEVIRYGAIFGLIGGIIGHNVVRHVLAPWQTRRQYKKYNAIKEPFNISVEPNGLRYTGTDTNSLLKWHHLMKWRENDEFVLVYQNTKLYHLIPKRLSTAGIDIKEIKRKLVETIGKAT